MKETIAHKAAIKCLLRCGTIGCSSMYMLLCTHYTQLGIEWDLAWNTLQPRTAITNFFSIMTQISFGYFVASYSLCVFFFDCCCYWKANNETRIAVARICLGDLGKNTIFHFLFLICGLHDEHGHGYRETEHSTKEVSPQRIPCVRSFIFRTTLRISLKFNEIHQKGTLSECGSCVCVRVVRFFVVVDIFFISFVAWLDSSCDKMLYLFRRRGFERKINSVKRNQTTRLCVCLCMHTR